MAASVVLSDTLAVFVSYPLFPNLLINYFFNYFNRMIADDIMLISVINEMLLNEAQLNGQVADVAQCQITTQCLSLRRYVTLLASLSVIFSCLSAVSDVGEMFRCTTASVVCSQTRVDQMHRLQTSVYYCNLVFHVSNGTNQQEDKHNRCSEEDYVRRRSCDRCRASGRIARRTGGVE